MLIVRAMIFNTTAVERQGFVISAEKQGANQKSGKTRSAEQRCRDGCPREKQTHQFSRLTTRQSASTGSILHIGKCLKIQTFALIRQSHSIPAFNGIRKLSGCCLHQRNDRILRPAQSFKKGNPIAVFPSGTKQFVSSKDVSLKSRKFNTCNFFRQSSRKLFGIHLPQYCPIDQKSLHRIFVGVCHLHQFSLVGLRCLWRSSVRVEVRRGEESAMKFYPHKMTPSRT